MTYSQPDPAEETTQAEQPEQPDTDQAFEEEQGGEQAALEIDSSDERMQKKIRTAQRSKVPFMLIAGEEDISKAAVSFRYRDGTQENGVPVDEAVAKILEAVRERR